MHSVHKRHSAYGILNSEVREPPLDGGDIMASKGRSRRAVKRGIATDLLEEESPPEGLLNLVGAPSGGGAGRGAAAGEDEDVDETPHQAEHLLHGHCRVRPPHFPSPFLTILTLVGTKEQQNPALFTLHSEPYTYSFSFFNHEGTSFIRLDLVITLCWPEDPKMRLEVIRG